MVSENEDKFVKKMGLSPTKIYHQALIALMRGLPELPGEREVYLSNATIKQRAKNDPGPQESAEPAPPEQDQDPAPAAPGSDLVDQLRPTEPGPEIRPAPAPVQEPERVLIVRKTRPASHIDTKRITLDIMKKGLTNNFNSFIDIQRE